MMIRHKLEVGMAVALLAGTAWAKADKVDVCHHTGNGGSHIINISANALPAHIANHGDNLVSGEICDGIDNDCNGAIDDGIDPTPTACGVGACAREGVLICEAGGVLDTCSPGAPTDEICGDGIDQDCDGEDLECDTPDNCTAAQYGGHDYLICQGQKTVSQSTAFCADEGMDLAFMDDLAENEAIVDAALAAYGYINFELTSYWVANRKSNPGIVPMPWAPGEPNSAADDCVHILRYGNHPYLWNDAGCESWTWGWVCESPSVGR